MLITSGVWIPAEVYARESGYGNDKYMQIENNYKILGVRIDNFNKKELFEKIEGFFLEEKFHQIATINPEFILEAQKNLEFKNILNNCTLNVADGFGIKLAFWRFSRHLKARVAGADLMLEILRMADEKKFSVFLAINKDGLSTFEEIKNAILKIYPKLIIGGADLSPKNDYYKRLKINNSILFCNFGVPYQELFMDSQKYDTIRLAMGVGGSFDFLTGKSYRAPKFLQFLGLEWFWRIFQPQSWEFKKERVKRIFRAVIIFPIRTIINK